MKQHTFYYTDNTERLTNNLSDKYEVIRKYNSNLGVLFSNFLVSSTKIKDEKWTGKIPLNTKDYWRKICPQKSLNDIQSIIYKEEVLYKYDKSYVIPDWENGIKGKATDYEIIAKEFYEHDGMFKKKTIKNKFLNKNLDSMDIIRKYRLSPSYMHIEKCLEYFTIDEEAAYKFTETITDEDKIKERDRKKSYNSCISIYNSYNKLHKDCYGRGHEKNTNLPKTLRQFVKLNGENWCNIDIKTAQPLFLCMYLKQIYKSESLDKFTNAVLNGDIYSEFESLNHLPRDKRKPKFYFFLFADNEKMCYSPMFAEFKEKYPSVLNFIQEIKKNNHKVLAQELQRLESNFIYETVIKKLIEINPFMLLSTIHDSIICLEEYKDLVRATMIIEFAKKYKTDLHLGIEKY